ncbi:MAG TPA: hypothetical protein VNH16_04915 [Burkholderiales bacterium]|jgi:hypothetical protein|nr:hypothetical protein [Burkholderiales bacterium]
MPFFEEWESFYVIVGAAAGALIGVQFVVMTLIAENPPPRVHEAGPAFATPTIVHFSAALLLSALVRIPWEGIAGVAALWGFVGLAGVAYGLVVARRMRRQTTYRPDYDDWVFFCLLPLVGYAVLGLSALIATTHPHDALLGVAGAALLLLFVGIHNAWDAIAYHVFVNMRKRKE